MSVYQRLFTAIKDDKQEDAVALALEAVEQFAERQERVVKALESIAASLDKMKETL